MKPTREQLILALLSVMDGWDDHDIQANTGFSESECKWLSDVREACKQEMPKWYEVDDLSKTGDSA